MIPKNIKKLQGLKTPNFSTQKVETWNFSYNYGF